MTREKNPEKRCQIIYIIQAALEYFFAIMVSGSFLATITSQLGMSDSMTGILSSFVSLGCLFQLASITYSRKKLKGFVITMSLINQAIFIILFLLPLSNQKGTGISIVFMVVLILAHFFLNFANPKKINWLMSFVENSNRGTFTATKEIVSLASGIVFTFIMSAVMDSFLAKGNPNGAFIVTAIVLLVIMITQAVCLFFVDDKEAPVKESKNIFKAFAPLLKNKVVLKITLIISIFEFAFYFSIPFMGVYQISDLKYSLTFISVISLISSFSRVLVSRFLGKLGDKKGFLYLFVFGLLLSAVSTLAVVFISPSSPTLAVIMMFVHGIILNVGVGALNNSKLNLCYDYVKPNLVADAYAFSIAIPGSIGFISSLIAGKLVDYIQGNGNTLFGIPVYAQQVLGLISTLLLLLDVLYIIFVFEKSKKN